MFVLMVSQHDKAWCYISNEVAPGVCFPTLKIRETG